MARQEDQYAPVLEDRGGEPGGRDRPGAAERWSAADLQQRLAALPDGHPSSPYDADGSLRPSPVDLRELELPLPDEVGPAEPGGAWAGAVQEARARWAEHQDRWPQEERTPADRGGDELGSWRGDGGQFLNVEENVVAGHAHERVCGAERGLTAALEDIEADVPGARLAGLEYRLKDEDRFKEKIAEGLALTPERPVERVVAKIPDAVRYTYLFNRDRYVDGSWEVRQKLEERGYSLALSINSWESDQYKGVNSRWRTDEGQLFEVQFHTPESFDAKQLTHEAYERLRNPRTDRHEMGELRAFQQEVSRNIPVPDRVDEIPDYPEKGR